MRSRLGRPSEQPTRPPRRRALYAAGIGWVGRCDFPEPSATKENRARQSKTPLQTLVCTHLSSLLDACIPTIFPLFVPCLPACLPAEGRHLPKRTLPRREARSGGARTTTSTNLVHSRGETRPSERSCERCNSFPANPLLSKEARNLAALVGTLAVDSSTIAPAAPLSSPPDMHWPHWSNQGATDGLPLLLVKKKRQHTR